MNEPMVGVRLIPSPLPPGLAAGPVIPFPSTEAERTQAAVQAAKVAVLLKKPSPGQVVLFRHLAETSPGGAYVVSTAKWIATILKATEGLSDDEMLRLQSFNWEERALAPGKLRRELMAALKDK